MTEETIFDAPQEQQQQVVQQPTTEVVPQELQEWVGEGKKYRNLSEIYKAFPHAQTHISTLQERVQQLETALNERKTAEQVLEEVRSNLTGQQKPTSQGVEVNESVLSSMVEGKLKEFVTKQKQEENLNVVVEAFTTTYGDKREELYKAIAEENGLTLQELNQLSAKSPKMVLKLAGLGEKQRVTSPNIHGSVNTQAIGNENKQQTVTSKVSPNASSKELADGWARARAIVNEKLKG